MTTNMTIAPELLDQLLANYEKPEDLTGEDGLFKQLKRALIERALEDDPHRGRRGRDCGAARPGGQLRAATDRQGPEAVRRLRRQDSEPLRPRHDGAGDPGPFGRALWSRSLARPHQPGHRCGTRRSPGVAEPAA